MKSDRDKIATKSSLIAKTTLFVSRQDNMNDKSSTQERQQSSKRGRRDYPSQPKFTHYPLNIKKDAILCAITNELFLRRPPQLKKSKYPPDKSKRCDYH